MVSRCEAVFILNGVADCISKFTEQARDINAVTGEHV